MSDVYRDSLKLHRTFQGKLGVHSLVELKDRKDLSLLYTPGVAEVSKQIAQVPSLSYDLTWRGRAVAVISDGSAVLGLGNIGPEAAMPVMEGKSLLLKQFGNVDSVPIVINTQVTSEIITFVKQIAPSFAGINLEDISAPRCFEVEAALQDIGIPVFHDDQHGTAIVVAAALQNAAAVVGKPLNTLRVVIIGAGAAGTATAKILLNIPVGDVIVVDSAGAIHTERKDLNSYKLELAKLSNKDKKTGTLDKVIKGADVVIGVSGPNTITQEMIKSMAEQPIVFAMANPTPEIMPELAHKAGAAVVASGRSDYPNQINNVLAFPGIFQAVVKGRLPKITNEMKVRAASALAALIPNPTADYIIPDVFFPGLAETVAEAVLSAS